MLYILFSFDVATAQSLTILSQETNTPIQNAEVFVIEQSKAYTSNKDGLVKLKPPLDSANCYVYASGFKMEVAFFNFLSRDKQVVYLKTWSENLTEVQVLDKQENRLEKLQLKSIDGMMLNASKKTQKINVEKIAANRSTNNSRQVYAQVPGLNIWESHGSGLNTEIGARGLSPIRSSNFNMRQNGYDISADALGYPDAYYVPPIDAVEEIQVVRGAATLQYGSQFGGMINYKLKQPSSKKISFESRQTAGSYGYFGSYNAISGSHKKTSYYNGFQYRRGNAWRDNSQFQSFFNYAHIDFTSKNGIKWTAEHTYFNYLAQQAGGLTDALFQQDPRQSIRDRNWFRVNWHLPSLRFDYKINNRLKVQSKTFALFASRDAVGFLGNITRIDLLTERDLLKDTYKNIGNETKALYRYRLKNMSNTLLAGFRLYSGFTTKKQGLGDDGNQARFEYLNPERLEGSDFAFPSRNIAVFAENIFNLSEKLSITPGFRIENIVTKSEGYYRETTTDLAGNTLSDTTINDRDSRRRSLALLGLGISYKPNNQTEVYGNITQNYRGVNFTDLRINNPNFRVDPNLEDETGFNADIGIRGRYKDLLVYDVGLFYLKYDNRIGFVLAFDSVLFNSSYRLRTNVSKSRSMGVESLVELDWLRLGQNIDKAFSLKSYVNFAYINGRYVASDEPAFDGNKIELVPEATFRTGLSFNWEELRLGLQYSYTSSHFTDATNSERTGNAVNGLIPSYYIMDFFARYQYKWLMVEANLNNITNNAYFTRRAAGYPGPGIIPADGIMAYFTLGAKF